VFRTLLYCSAALLLLTSCKKEEKAPEEDWGDPTMQVTSTAFKEGEAIPKQYTADGKDVSPPLQWSGAPEGARSFALICDDPDAPTKTPWVHWVLYNLPADKHELPEAVSTKDSLASGAKQGKNDFKKPGYGGPSPPSGTHRYFFKVYALNDVLELPAGATKADLEKAMKGHVLAHGQLMGKYSR
jgi:Raf kinase inhibitor-like YbhB/YbcL family protein